MTNDKPLVTVFIPAFNAGRTISATPIDSKIITQITLYNKKIITLEEHQRSAGLGLAVLECLYNIVEKNEINTIPKIERIAIPDQFISVAGSQEHLRHLSGLQLPNFSTQMK